MPGRLVVEPSNFVLQPAWRSQRIAHHGPSAKCAHSLDMIVRIDFPGYKRLASASSEIGSN